MSVLQIGKIPNFIPENILQELISFSEDNKMISNLRKGMTELGLIQVIYSLKNNIKYLSILKYPFFYKNKIYKNIVSLRKPLYLYTWNFKKMQKFSLRPKVILKIYRMHLTVKKIFIFHHEMCIKNVLSGNFMSCKKQLNLN